MRLSGQNFEIGLRIFLFDFENLGPEKIVKKRGLRFSKSNKKNSKARSQNFVPTISSKWSLEHILKVGEDRFLDSIFRARD